MREPVFNETLQLGIVVRDLEATMRTYVDADRGDGVISNGKFGGTRVAYLGTDRDLGMIIEIFNGTLDDCPDPAEN